MTTLTAIESKKAQLALKKFHEIADVHLGILKERRENIGRCRLRGDHRALSIEKSRADLVVKQLYDLVQQMFSWCSDLQMETWEWVQYQLRPLNTRIQCDLADFVRECDNAQTAQPLGHNAEQTSGDVSGIKNSLPQWRLDEETHGTNSSDHDLLQGQKLLLLADSVEQRQQEADAHRRLLHDILELNEIMKEMDAVVRVQGETIETIEGNINRAVSNVEAGERHLVKAVKLKAARYPVAGALIGAGAVAGPVGILVGFKVAMVAAVGGCALGAMGGNFLRQKAIAKVSTDARTNEVIADANIHERKRKGD